MVLLIDNVASGNNTFDNCINVLYVSCVNETYKTLISLSKVLLPDAQLSISKTIESIANEKAKKLNGKIKKS